MNDSFEHFHFLECLNLIYFRNKTISLLFYWVKQSMDWSKLGMTKFFYKELSSISLLLWIKCRPILKKLKLIYCGQNFGYWKKKIWVRALCNWVWKCEWSAIILFQMAVRKVNSYTYIAGILFYYFIFFH